MSMFSVFNLTPPTEEVLRKIYGSIIENFYEDGGYTDAAKSAAGKVTGLTLSLYNSLVEKLPPTPAKFHYIFNLRDLGRIYEGLTTVTPDTVTTEADVARLWRNECCRIFADRLVSDEDHAVVATELEGLIRRGFGEASDHALKVPLLYGDFSQALGRLSEEKEDLRLYRDLGNFDSVRSTLDSVLQLYNEEVKTMSLVLFQQALEHLTRILRVLRMRRGNALLVGVGGSGKQSLTRLATYTAGYELFTITMSRNYGEKDFRDDLKELYKLLAVKPVVFLFTDADVAEEGFLELVNNMLSTGMVPALYDKDEKDVMVNQVRSEVKSAGIEDTADNCWAYFVSKCRNNLHVVLAMSPSGDTLRRRCRNFPGLVSSCVIDWFFPWPADALEKVASHFLRAESLPEEHRTSVIEHMVHVHESVVTASKRF